MSIHRFNELIVETPEGVRFVHRLASPVIRFLAFSIDIATIMMVVSILSVAVSLLGLVSIDLALAFSILLYFVVSIGYFIVLEMLWRGQTLGKRLMKLRVIDASGLKLRPNQIVVRNLLRFVDSFPVLYLLGGVVALLSVRSQRLGDLAADTVVVREIELLSPNLTEVSEAFYNSFRECPRLEAKLRQAVVPEESELALQALRRRDEIDPIARAKLFGVIAKSFREQVVFPADITASMSDEQYVRNCVDTIFRRK